MSCKNVEESPADGLSNYMGCERKRETKERGVEKSIKKLCYLVEGSSHILRKNTKRGEKRKEGGEGMGKNLSNDKRVGGQGNAF